MTLPICVRNLDPTDVGVVVAVHLQSFPRFFLSFLGPSFLRELYLATLADASGLGFVAEDNNGICGFVTGTSEPRGFYRRLLRERWWRFGLASLKPVLKRPAIIPRLLRAFSMPDVVTKEVGRGTLMSIAVLPTVQNAGVGHELVRAFLEKAASKNLRYVDLTTDRDDNDAVNRFYQNLGFACERVYTTPEGRSMIEYVIDLTPNTLRENGCR